MSTIEDLIEWMVGGKEVSNLSFESDPVIGNVILYRGIKNDIIINNTVIFNGCSSWTYSKKVAYKFNPKHVIMMICKGTDILCDTTLVQFTKQQSACLFLDEQEVIIRPGTYIITQI
jgi:hypothetical protein